jgi:hypothetical protein
VKAQPDAELNQNDMPWHVSALFSKSKPQKSQRTLAIDRQSGWL